MLKILKENFVGTEEYYFVNDRVINPVFNVLLAGMTEPDSNYFIYHPACKVWVFEYVISGKGYIVTENETYTVKEGDFYAISETTECYYYSDYNNPLKKIWINLTGNLVRHLMHDYNMKKKIIILHTDISELFNELLENFKNGQNDFTAAQLKFHEMIAFLAPIRVERAEKSVVEVVHDYILDNAHENIKIDELCKKFFISKVHLSQLFKKEYGISPYKYFSKCKMELAVHMLLNSDMPIKEIALSLSYSDSHHFSNAFRDKYECSPKEYRVRYSNHYD